MDNHSALDHGKPALALDFQDKEGSFIMRVIPNSHNDHEAAGEALSILSAGTIREADDFDVVFLDGHRANS